MTRYTRDFCIRNVLDRIGAASVFGYGAIIEINATSDFIIDNILKNTSESNCIKDLRFFLTGQVYTLGITAALNVEDSMIGPAMLIITDQVAMNIGGQGGFTRPGKSKE